VTGGNTGVRGDQIRGIKQLEGGNKMKKEKEDRK
jgi:hypothetical protein